MLREFVEKKHYLFAEKASDWEEAIRMSCKSLEADGTVDAGYAEDIIACVRKYGPYIVIMPKVAMPHAQEGAAGVSRTAIGFMKLNQPVSFDPEDPEKDASVFFTLATCDPEQHLENMTKLSEILMNDVVVSELVKAEGPEDLLRIQETYLDKK